MCSYNQVYTVCAPNSFSYNSSVYMYTPGYIQCLFNTTEIVRHGDICSEGMEKQSKNV